MHSHSNSLSMLGDADLLFVADAIGDDLAKKEFEYRHYAVRDTAGSSARRRIDAILDEMDDDDLDWIEVAS